MPEQKPASSNHSPGLFRRLMPVNPFSLEGAKAFTMPRFYLFFAKWLCWVMLITYGAVLIPIKLTATKALHVADARIALLFLQNAMFDKTLNAPPALYQAELPPQLATPLSVEAGLERLRQNPYVTVKAVTTPLRVSGMPKGTHCLQPEYMCYTLLMNKKYHHAGVFAYNLKHQELIYDVDGGIQLKRYRLLQALNVMSLFPLIDGRPFYFSVMPSQQLRPIASVSKSPKPNTLRQAPRLYGFIPLFDKKDLTNQQLRRILLLNSSTLP